MLFRSSAEQLRLGTADYRGSAIFGSLTVKSLSIATPKAYTSALGTLPDPTKIAYTLVGWYTAASGGSKISTTTTMPAANTTYYAQWTPKKNASVYTNGAWKDGVLYVYTNGAWKLVTVETF